MAKEQLNEKQRELSILESRCNEHSKLNDELKGQLSEKTNALEDALRHNIDK